MKFIVTVKKHNRSHDPKNKQKNKCIVSNDCTDSTGHHHSVLVEASDIWSAELKVYEKYVLHITKVERVMDVIE